MSRTIRVDHVSDYKPPKDNEKADEITRRLQMEGCAPKAQIPVENIKQERDKTSERNEFGLPQRLPIDRTIKTEPGLKKVKVKKEKKKKSKKEKKSKKAKKEKKSKKRKKSSSSDESSTEESTDSDEDERKRRKK